MQRVRRRFMAFGVAGMLALVSTVFLSPSAGGAAVVPEADGSGVHVYVVDSGIRSTHVEFDGRVVPGVSFVNDGKGTDDCTGHGTHVSGIIGGKHFGVARNVTLVPVRVVNCSGDGSVESLVSALHWVTANRQMPAVVSLSLTAGTPVAAIDDAIAELLKTGVTIVAAAGNDNKNACDSSPARDLGVLAVASVDTMNRRAKDSNWGPCVGLFAPGVSILSAWNRSDTATAHDSGTSMASPYVVGLAARYLQRNPSASPTDVGEHVRMSASVDLVEDAGSGSPNLMAAPVLSR
jgi:subtilisin family serine protease